MVTSWQTGREGRRLIAEGALFGEQENLLAVAHAIWIVVDRKVTAIWVRSVVSILMIKSSSALSLISVRSFWSSAFFAELRTTLQHERPLLAVKGIGHCLVFGEQATLYAESLQCCFVLDCSLVYRNGKISVAKDQIKIVHQPYFDAVPCRLGIDRVGLVGNRADRLAALATCSSGTPLREIVRRELAMAAPAAPSFLAPSA